MGEEITLTEGLLAVKSALEVCARILDRLEEERIWLSIKEAAPRLGVSDRKRRAKPKDFNHD